MSEAEWQSRDGSLAGKGRKRLSGKKKRLSQVYTHTFYQPSTPPPPPPPSRSPHPVSSSKNDLSDTYFYTFPPKSPTPLGLTKHIPSNSEPLRTLQEIEEKMKRKKVQCLSTIPRTVQIPELSSRLHLPFFLCFLLFVNNVSLHVGVELTID